jgi:hypothetical protein
MTKQHHGQRWPDPEVFFDYYRHRGISTLVVFEDHTGWTHRRSGQLRRETVAGFFAQLLVRDLHLYDQVRSALHRPEFRLHLKQKRRLSEATRTLAGCVSDLLRDHRILKKVKEYSGWGRMITFPQGKRKVSHVFPYNGEDFVDYIYNALDQDIYLRDAVMNKLKNK